MELVNNLIHIVNFLMAKSPKQHRQLKVFLEEHESAYHDTPLHTAVRWLSKGKVLSRMWELREDICLFLEQLGNIQAIQYISFLQDKQKMTTTAFLVEMFDHLDKISLQLQGKLASLVDLRRHVKSFNVKLDIFKDDIANEMLYFESLKKYSPDADVSTFIDFINGMRKEFEERLSDCKFCDDLLIMVKNPFVVEVNGKWLEQAISLYPHLSKANLQIQLIDLQSDDELGLIYANSVKESSEKFWISLNFASYLELRTLSMKVLGMFGSTYICEQSFSNMNFIKSKCRNSLSNSHLEDILRICTTEYVPNFPKIAKDLKCHMSH